MRSNLNIFIWINVCILQVKWQSRTKDGFEDYPVRINYDIEQAYLGGENSFSYESDNGPIKIDFYNMVVRQISVAGSDKQIRRYAPGNAFTN